MAWVRCVWVGFSEIEVWTLDCPAGLECREDMVSRKQILDQELEGLRRQIGSLDRRRDEKPDYRLGGGAPSVTRWELDQAILQQLKEKLSRMEQALLADSDRVYGTCRRCGQLIDADRLVVLPGTDLCAACAGAEMAGR